MATLYSQQSHFSTLGAAKTAVVFDAARPKHIPRMDTAVPGRGTPGTTAGASV
ncbi:MAG: hypothetical protein JW902_09715 [Syntrophaceae bacterium]|nr:hypothetical protein [Syntrophaceae bacterium]